MQQQQIAPTMKSALLMLMILLALQYFVPQYADAADWSTVNLTLQGSYPTNYMSWMSATMSGDRRLMVSDSPESLTDANVDTDHVLWHDEVQTTDCGIKHHRIFLWHVNNTASYANIRIGVTIQNLTANTITFTNRQVSELYGSVNSDILGTSAKQQAIDCLGGSMSSITGTVTVNGNSVGTVREWSSVANGYLRGAILDFTVIGETTLHYKIRTIACPTTQSITSFTGDPQDEIVHNRGSWNGDSVKLACEPISYGGSKYRLRLSNNPVRRDGNGNIVYLADGHYDIIWGSDSVFRRDNSYDSTRAVGNRGDFGVTMMMSIPMANSNAATKHIKMYVNAENTGAPYAGAGRYGGDTTFKGIPKINYGTASDAAGTIFDIPVKSRTQEIRTFRIMHAGGSTLPVGLYFVWY